MVVKRDLAVIGGGPGGYVAAIRAAQLKKSVVLFEADMIGGTCMNWGCIPTKHLLHQTKVYKDVKSSKALGGPVGEIFCDWPRVQEEKRRVVARLVKGTEFLLQRNGVDVVRARARLRNERQVVVPGARGEDVYDVEKVILATGSRPAELPFMKIDRKLVVTSTEALDFGSVPKAMLVVGAGAIGIEIGTIYRRLGAGVTILEIMPTILPGSDREMAVRLERVLKMQGLNVVTQAKIEEFLCRDDGRAVVRGHSLRDGTAFVHEADVVLLAAGRRANSENLAADSSLIALQASGSVSVNDRLETSLPGVYAIGDLIGGKLLAHKASNDGLAAAANAAGGREVVDDRAIPLAVFTEPEFASVGLTEEEARRESDKVRTGVFSFQANGRALTMDSPEGLVKIVAGADDRILGAHILGPSASDLIAELTMALRTGLRIRDVARTVHIHPTLGEAVMEAALKARGEAIHALN